MRFLKLTLSYDGTAFAGWQVQPNQRTVQETLEQAIVKITGQAIRATASGRTDAGVHALGQVVSIAVETQLSAEVFCRALNANTPEDVAVLSVEEALTGFHAIRDAVSKRYRYVILDGPLPDVFLRQYAWHIPSGLDVDAMNRSTKSLIGKHDFSSFEASGSPRADSVRTVSDLTVERDAECHSRVVVEIAADGFLYNMVRNIVGTLVEVGRGTQPVAWPHQVLAGKDRKLAGMTAPAHGLFLVSVDYSATPDK